MTGGTDALGLVTAQWLVARGARHVVLVSRSGRVVRGAEREWELLQACDADVQVHCCDVQDAGGVTAMVGRVESSVGAIQGVVHAAGVLADAMLVNQSQESLQAVWGPKVVGAYNLHDATRHCDLGLFVLFSSTASMLGSTGQTNYGAANAALDGLARERRACGKSAVSVQWKV